MAAVQSIVRAVELAAAVLEELGSARGPRQDAIAANCGAFMKAMKDVQTTLQEEIASVCEQRPYENSDYLARCRADIQAQKVDCVLRQLQEMQDFARTPVS
eukprot:SM000101S09301  [mRNA]  locus=s101:455173:455896:- [translate_table: standard]